ncbi:hypothetical protein pb186bvf_012978 [Paramecium bursaria]
MKPWNRYRTNSLLMRDSVGVSKNSTQTIPQEVYFGKPIMHDLEGAQEVVLNWRQHQSSQDLLPDRDFTKLNKMCVTNCLHKSDQFTNFRRSADARVSIKKGTNLYSVQLPDENFRYGKPYAPQSPMRMILAHGYANEAEKIMEIKYDQITKYQDSVRKSSKPRLQTKHTKASSQTHQAIKEKLKTITYQKKDLFKLSQFDNVCAKTQTRNWKTPERK